MYSVGIDIGYSSVKVALIGDGDEVVYAAYLLHGGRIRETLARAVGALLERRESREISFGAATGGGALFLTRGGKIGAVNEVAAILEGSVRAGDGIGSIIEIGGQSAKYITDFTGDDRSRVQVSLNSDCSAGTGSFLEEQVSRLDLALEDYARYAERGTSIPRIAGRCSVFAKTDITHHQQEGVPVEDILLGLAHATVKNYRGAVMRKLPRNKPILFVGGVAHNRAIVDVLKEELHLADGELIVPDHYDAIGAVGAAIIAKKENIVMDRERLAALSREAGHHETDEKRVRLPRLSPFGTGDGIGRHEYPGIARSEGRVSCCLGIDVGSTSTNLVLTDEDDAIVFFTYLRTGGNPVEAVRRGLVEIEAALGDRVRVVGVGVTGSGRHMIGELVGADVVKNEITSQARAATVIDEDVDTIFEIGGQDSKYISLKDGVVRDFQMNKVCAAGTGSFIEEQAHKFNIPLDRFGDIALESESPIHLGERCTVFMETGISAHLAGGAALTDIASGLCYSIAKNYLNRVVGKKNVGDTVFFQGGVAYNQGVVNALRALTGKDIIVPPFFSVTGAYGAAILAREEAGRAGTRFVGFDMGVGDPSLEREKGAGREVNNTEVFNRQVEALIFEGYDGTIEDGRKTVGIPRALFTFGMFPMFYTFFKELGFNVILSDPTSEATIRLGQEYSLDEACYPVKLINGHVAELVKRKVDYIFFPDLYNVDHPGSHTRQNYGCAYMQLAFKVINRAMELGEKGIALLAPTIAFSLGKEFMMKSFMGLGEKLGRKPEEIQRALAVGMEAFVRFEERIEKQSEKVIEEIRPNEKVLVLISKIYGVADPVLNMGIPGKLMDMGYKVISFFNLPEGDISGEHPNMFWPFGQHILEPAKLIKRHPNMYAILLSHHGCGPDSVLTHYFREIMGKKPYLNIEVDEHCSDVGVITRIEAFVDSLKGEPAAHAEKVGVYLEGLESGNVNIETRMRRMRPKAALYIPALYPYSRIVRQMLIGEGIDARVLPATDGASIDLGRKHTLTNEYLSLTALLGGTLKLLNGTGARANGTAVLIPQTEGAELDGQANRFVRAKLDEEGYNDVAVVSPFVEDAIAGSREGARRLFLALLAGDVIQSASPRERENHLSELLDTMEKRGLDIRDLIKIAEKVRREQGEEKGEKRILAIGETFILFNDYLNNFSFVDMEKKGYRVLYAPLSEYLWLFWRDYLRENGGEAADSMREGLDELGGYIQEVSGALSGGGVFESDLEALAATADGTVGYYAGAFGRYREAKILGDLGGIDGIITVASTYENTAISLGILHRGFENSHTRPVLNLTFDGSSNENNRTKIESFVYYLK